MPRKPDARDGLKWGEGSIRSRARAGGTETHQARWLEQDGAATRLRSKSFATLAEAEDHLRSVLRAKEEGRYRPPSTWSVAELVRDYIDRALAAGRITERTALTYRKRAVSMIDPTIGKRRVEQLVPLDVQRWIDGLTRGGFAPSTVHAAVAVLMGTLREAALLGVTDRHLGQGVRRPALGRPDATAWTADEVRTILNAVDGEPRFGALYWVAITTGLRPGELRAVKWQDVNLETGVLTVRRTITKDVDGHEVIADRTKGKTTRAVALAKPVVDRLRRHKTIQTERRLAAETWQDHGLVFDRGDGHWMYASHWDRFHRQLCGSTGVPLIRLHDIRHTSASLELEQGTHPRIVSERLGHKTVAMTLDRYSHVSAALQRSAADALAERLVGDHEAKSVAK